MRLYFGWCGGSLGGVTTKVVFGSIAGHYLTLRTPGAPSHSPRPAWPVGLSLAAAAGRCLAGEMHCSGWVGPVQSGIGGRGCVVQLYYRAAGSQLTSAGQSQPSCQLLERGCVTSSTATTRLSPPPLPTPITHNTLLTAK